MPARTIIYPGPPAKSVFTEALDAVDRLEHVKPHNGHQLVEITSNRRENVALVARLLDDAYMETFGVPAEYMIPAADGKSYLSLPVPSGAECVDPVQLMRTLGLMRSDILGAVRNAQAHVPPGTFWKDILDPKEYSIRCDNEQHAQARHELLHLLMQAHGHEDASRVENGAVIFDLAAGNDILNREKAKKQQPSLFR